MAQLPTAIPFDRWLDYLFGAPVGPSGFRESDDWWDESGDPALAVAYLTRLFEGAGDLLGRYPEEQIDRGWWFLLGESGHLQPLFGDAVGWDARRKALLTIEQLFARLFLPACSGYLGHLDAGPEPPAPLNSSCYMWWDLFPTWGGGAGADPVADAVLEVLAGMLRLESEACREAALHGLGHWHLNYPERAAAIVDEWLATDPNISVELRRYAASARAGCVL
jgi:hypothetical protein